MSRPPRTQREIDEARNLILRAAAEVFAEKGFEASTMHEIARAANYSAPTLYSYFKGKRAILDELIAQSLDEVDALFALDLPVQLCLRQKLELLLRHQNAWFEHRRIFLLFASRESRPQSRNSGAAPTDTDRELRSRLVTWFRDHSSDAERGHHSAENVALFVFGVQQAFVQRWMQTGARESLNVELPNILAMIFSGLSNVAVSTTLQGRFLNPNERAFET